MNNEPVAWAYESTNVDGKPYLSDVSLKPLFGLVTRYGYKEIPLYTHPVKEQDTDCQYCKQGCIRCDARKQLTDEEIFATALEQYGHSVGLYGNHIGFARAVLRKAQEK